MVYKKVTHISPYVPKDTNLRGYMFDFTVEGGTPQRVDEMPYAQMQVIISMAHKNRLMYDEENEHFAFAGDGNISDWVIH